MCISCWEVVREHWTEIFAMFWLHSRFASLVRNRCCTWWRWWSCRARKTRESPPSPWRCSPRSCRCCSCSRRSCTSPARAHRCPTPTRRWSPCRRDPETRERDVTGWRAWVRLTLGEITQASVGPLKVSPSTFEWRRHDVSKRASSQAQVSDGPVESTNARLSRPSHDAASWSRDVTAPGWLIAHEKSQRTVHKQNYQTPIEWRGQLRGRECAEWKSPALTSHAAQLPSCLRRIRPSGNSTSLVISKILHWKM